MTRVFGCQMVGIGPGTLGVLLAADRLGVLPKVLDLGVALVDRLPKGRTTGANGLAYGVSSNSRGGEMIAGIAGDGAFALPYASFWGRRIQAAREKSVRLRAAARFFNALAEHACAIVQEHEAGGYVSLGREVVSITVAPRGRIWTRDADGQTIAVSKKIVLSPGGRQDTDGLRVALPDGDPRPVFQSDQLLREGGGELVRQLRSGTARCVGIVGGSHSALSVALVLVHRAGRHLADGAVRIVHRVPVRHYYGSLAEARRMRINQEPLEICPDTGIVNRFDGLRGEAAAFSRLVLTGQERRVSLVRTIGSRDSLNDALGGVDVLVNATGYDAPPLQFFASNGQALDIDRRRGFPVDDRNRLLRSDGVPLDGVYITGLARRFVSPARPSLQAIGAGAGVFQQIDGVTIAQELAGGASAATQLHPKPDGRPVQ